MVGSAYLARRDNNLPFANLLSRGKNWVQGIQISKLLPGKTSADGSRIPAFDFGLGGHIPGRHFRLFFEPSVVYAIRLSQAKSGKTK
jgi:hypothetical protein